MMTSHSLKQREWQHIWVCVLTGTFQGLRWSLCLPLLPIPWFLSRHLFHWWQSDWQGWPVGRLPWSWKGGVVVEQIRHKTVQSWKEALKCPTDLQPGNEPDDQPNYNRLYENSTLMLFFHVRRQILLQFSKWATPVKLLCISNSHLMSNGLKCHRKNKKKENSTWFCHYNVNFNTALKKKSQWFSHVVKYIVYKVLMLYLSLTANL